MDGHTQLSGLSKGTENESGKMTSATKINFEFL